MKSIDIRSEPAVKLLAEFLDIDAEYDSEDPRANAEHFAHGMQHAHLDFVILTSGSSRCARAL